MTFKVTNASAPGITEMELLKDQRIVGEKENLAPGLDPVTFTVTLDGGAVQDLLPRREQRVPGPRGHGPGRGGPHRHRADDSRPGHEGLRGVRRRPGQPARQRRSRRSTPPFSPGNVDDAKNAYAKARPFYERAESSVDGFVLPGFAVDDNAGNLDYLIDMRESTPVDAKVGWKGFHAIERDLYQGNAITPAPRR